MEFKQLTTDSTLRKMALIIFALLCANKLGIYVTGGENQYLGLAKQFINPGWIPGSFSLSEPPGTRLLFQVIVGPVMQVLDFVTAVFVLRTISFALLAVPMALIFRTFKFTLIETFVIGQFLIMGPQCFFGGEWIYESFEPKTLAYVFLFYALYYVIKERWTRSAIFLAVATCFHLLVGGWFAIVLAVSFLLRGELRKRFRYLLTYGLAVLPILAYILYGYLTNTPEEVPVNLDWVYAYYRLPNHLGIFRDLEFFLSQHAAGVGVGILAYIFLWIKRDLFKRVGGRFQQLALIILSINLFFVVVALADHVLLDNSGGLFLKSYPFRSNSIGYFMFVIMLSAILVEKIRAHRHARRIGISLVSIFAVLLILFTFFNVRRSFDSFRDPDFDAMAKDIGGITQPGDVFVILDLGSSGVMYNSFTRKAERENFSVFKFVPYQRDKLYEWYQRTLALEQVNADLGYLETIKESYAVDYLLSRGEVDSEHLVLRHRNDSYFLYTIQ